MARPSPARLRLIIFGLLAALVLTLATVAFCHPAFRTLMHDPRALGASVRGWTQTHPITAEGTLILVHVLLTMTGMPIWWVQVLAGYAFGPLGGTVRCVIAASIAATITAQFWNWLAADLAGHTLFRRVRVLQMLKHFSGDGGLMVVIITRLAHLVPFGISNYFFGMLGIRWHAVMIGTLIGVIPSATLYVCLGAGIDWHTQWLFPLVAGLISLAGLGLGGWMYARHRADHHDGADDK